ncbi:unnamed protein product [Rodentolepis nana]|uniref:Protein aurora borealis n=1 Tax=Rodentolepis nana TaxID=102285 RepID=A0A0R3T097_RODNA|nr:unnamed protein product [Rodentolepis nana]
MEEQTVLRFARLLSLPDYENTFSWLPVNGEVNSKLPTSSSDTEISPNRKNSHISGIKTNLFFDLPTANTPTKYIFNDDFSPPVPELSTLPPLDEVTFSVFDIAEKSNPNSHSLFVGANSIPPSIELSNFSPSGSGDIDVSTKPSTLPISSKLMRSFSLNRQFPGKLATTSLERLPLKRHFISTGDIIPLPSCHPIKLENFFDAFKGDKSHGSFPTFFESPITAGKLNRESSIVEDEHETHCYSAISGLSSVGESDVVKEIVYVSRSQSDLEFTIPPMRSRSLIFLPNYSDSNGRGKISPDRNSDISPYCHPQHSPLIMGATALGADLPALMTDDDDVGWMKSSKSPVFDSF